MTTFLAISLLVISVASTLSAFGGWKEGPEHLLKRITPRGWIALICLSLTLVGSILKELYSNSEGKRKEAEAKQTAEQDRHDAETRQAALQSQLKVTQGQLELANAKLELANAKLQLAGTRLKDLKEQSQKTQDQITGGNGFPIASILTFNPDTDGSFPLWVMPSDDTPLYDVSYKVIEGAIKLPTPEELKQMQATANAFLTGHGNDSTTFLGVLDPRKIVPLGNARIHPSKDGVNTYRIVFNARNGSAMEVMEVRFNQSENIWQYRYESRSQDPRTANKLLGKQDWIPKKYLPPIYGVGPPSNH